MFKFIEKESLSSNKAIVFTSNFHKKISCDKPINEYPIEFKFLDRGNIRVIYPVDYEIKFDIARAEKNSALIAKALEQEKAPNVTNGRPLWEAWDLSISVYLDIITRMCPTVKIRKGDLPFLNRSRKTVSGIGNSGLTSRKFCMELGYVLGVVGILLKEESESIVMDNPNHLLKINVNKNDAD